MRVYKSVDPKINLLSSPVFVPKEQVDLIVDGSEKAYCYKIEEVKPMDEGNLSDLDKDTEYEKNAK